MRRNNSFIWIVALVIFTLLVPAHAQAAQKTIRWAYSIVSKKGQAAGWEWMGPEFEKRTKGRYKVDYYPGETLFKQSSALDSVLTNVAQVAEAVVTANERRLPFSQMPALPAYDFPSTLKGRMAVEAAFMQVCQKFPQVLNEYKGLKLFGYEPMSSYIYISKKKEVYLPEHFKGLKVGGTGNRMRLVTTNGGAEVNQTAPDAYMNMDKGVVDGSFASWTIIYQHRLWEIAKYFYEFSFGSSAFALVMNLDFWNSMDPGDQKIWMELWPKAYQLGLETSWAEVELGRKAAVDSGAKIRTPTREEIALWMRAADPVARQWVSDVKKVGGKDPETVLAEWERLVQGYKE